MVVAVAVRVDHAALSCVVGSKSAVSEMSAIATRLAETCLPVNHHPPGRSPPIGGWRRPMTATAQSRPLRVLADSQRKPRQGHKFACIFVLPACSWNLHG